MNKLYWIIIVPAALTLLLHGCSLIPYATEPTELTPTQQLQEMVQGTNWLMTLAILGVGAGFFSFLNGGTKGIQIIASCLVVISLVLGITRYSTWIALIAVIGAVSLLIYTILARAKAIKEIVRGVQNVKDAYRNSSGDRTVTTINPNDVLFENLSKQSPSTQAIVKNVKQNLNS